MPPDRGNARLVRVVLLVLFALVQFTLHYHSIVIELSQRNKKDTHQLSGYARSGSGSVVSHSSFSSLCKIECEESTRSLLSLVFLHSIQLEHNEERNEWNHTAAVRLGKVLR